MQFDQPETGRSGDRPGGISDVVLVDPGLFTAPYDAALSAGLAANKLRPRWLTRGLRPGEEDELGTTARPLFYRNTDGARRRTGRLWQVAKGIEHGIGLRDMVGLIGTLPVDIVHFQWAMLPLLDSVAIGRLRRYCPVVLTVHDTTPFNGKAVNPLQRHGFERVLRSVDRLIVHTAEGRAVLVAQGLDPARIAVIPHGLLSTASIAEPAVAGSRWRIVQFGKLQDYKGADVLIEALGQLSPGVRARLSVVLAGEPFIDTAPLLARAAALQLDPPTLEFRLHRHSKAEMDALLVSADAFVFPYRAIEASGVLYDVAPRRRWIVASDLGAFRELIGNGGDAGTLVAPGDTNALASALSASIGQRPTRDISAAVPSWTEIGAMTVQAYEQATLAWHRYGPGATH